MEKIQVLAISISLIFLAYIFYLIVKGKLREEYSIVWIICTIILVVFSFWRKGLEFFADLFGIIDPPNLVFTGAIFAILIYLLHLSIVVSKLQKENKTLSREIALMKEKEREQEKKNQQSGN